MQPWLTARFDTAGGPGGQHANKASTRVTLLFDFQQCPALSDGQRQRIARRLENRLSADGQLRVVAQVERSQAANRAAAEQRLMELLAQALHVPTQRIATRPTRGSQRRRLTAKRQRGAVKRDRQRGVGDE